MSVKNFLKNSENQSNLSIKNNEFDFKDFSSSDDNFNYFRRGLSIDQITIVKPSLDVKLSNISFKLPHELEEIAKAIEASKYLLKLEDDWDDCNAIAPSENIYNRAITFLVNYSKIILERHKIIIQPPEINPGKNGSIDLDWRSNGVELLINFVNSDVFAASYYGDNGNNNLIIEGILDSDMVNDDLAYWMRKLK